MTRRIGVSSVATMNLSAVRLKMLVSGLTCAALAFTISASGSTAAGSGSGTFVFLKLSDSEGKVKGDVTQKGREGAFAVDNYEADFTPSNCDPLEVQVRFNPSWGRLTADRGETFPRVELLNYRPSLTGQSGQGVERLELDYDFHEAALSKIRHTNGNKLTLTFIYQSVDMTQYGPTRTDSVTCVS